MGKIVLLDDLTINQIAAGEVIERPASVIKELVENSIDAGAKNINIDIKNGGISYIRITDDGSGILADDMEIAFERHATSKIRKAEDLDKVKSMGFRGEALASIAAIAKVELVSKTETSDFGYKIVLEGGDIIDKHEEGATKGTTITVKELFFNTPVRYKFLKKDFTESGYIEDMVTRIALANPAVAIKLVNTGKTVIQTNGSGKLEDCIYAIFGKEVTQNIIPVDYNYEDLHITGVIGKPLISRSNRSNQLFYVNNRFVKDKTLTSAAEQAFKGLVTIGKHGFLILNIDMDPKKVDVNVHPTKLEIRFQDDSTIFKAVYHAIKETLLKGDLVSDTEKDYSELTPNDILKEIKNKDRVEAWDINKNNTIKKQPEFSEFKNTISNLDDSTRSKFIEEIIKAKSSDDIVKGLSNYTNLLKGNNATSVAINEKDDIDNQKNNEKIVNTNSNEIENIKEENSESTEQSFNETELSYNAEIDNSKKEVENPKEQVSQEINNKNNDQGEDEIKPLVQENNKQETSQENTLAQEKVQETNTAETQETNISATMSFEEMYKKLFGRNIEDARKEYETKLEKENSKYPITPITNNEISMFEKEGIDKNPQYSFIGIAFKTYIILTMGEDLYILDQHAAHERIMYEKVKANYYSQGEKDSQLMLLPDIINLSNKEMGIFRDNKDMFIKAGFVVDEFGDNTVKLTGVPEFCLNFDTKEIFLETLDEIDTVARTAKQELENKFLATVACKAAVKAHMALNKEEVDSLMEQLLKLPNPFSCPHGRPTVIKMSKTDIEKKFSRR